MVDQGDRTAARPLRIAVVNDYEVVVRGVAAMLADVESLEVVELLSGEPPSQPVDVVLYDAFGMHGLTSAELKEMLHTGDVGAVVLYTWQNATPLIEDARAAGMAGVIDRSTRGVELTDLLHRAHAGEFVVSAGADKPIDEWVTSADWPGKSKGLSAREAEVIGLITQGLSNDEIAQRIYVSINSVKTHIRSAYRTMGVTTRSQAVLWGVENGMAPQRLRISLRDA